MSIDTLLRTQLTAAVADTTLPPGLAHHVVAGGRRRRRRRMLGGAAALVAVVGAAAVAVQLPGGDSLGREGEVAAGASAELADGLRWARSLPQGSAPALPFFGEGGLWSDGQMYDTLGDEVSYDHPPRAVAGGWLVATGHGEEPDGLAVMAPDGSLRDLPLTTSAEESTNGQVAVSADGRRVALGSRLVDLTTMVVTTLPHAPEEAVQDGYYTDVRVVGFVDDGLVYEASPYEKGVGLTWLLHDDGSTVPLSLPEGAHISDSGPADVAVRFDYSPDETDTCVRTWRLRDAAWVEGETSCMGQYLGEALAVSPGAEWLLTDDLPRVWSIADGRWERLDMPVGVGPAQMDAQRGGAVWESDDTFLLPVADRWTGPTTPEPEFFQHVQVVRCSLSTLACERAGDEQYLPVVSTTWGTSQVAFASP